MLTEVIGNVETAVVVGAVLEVDDNELLFAAGGLLADEDVALLEIVVAEHDRGFQLVQVLAHPLHFRVQLEAGHARR